MFKLKNYPYPKSSCCSSCGSPLKSCGCGSKNKSPMQKKDCNCWKGHSRVPGTEPCAPGSCEKD